MASWLCCSVFFSCVAEHFITSFSEPRKNSFDRLCKVNKSRVKVNKRRKEAWEGNTNQRRSSVSGICWLWILGSHPTLDPLPLSPLGAIIDCFLFFLSLFGSHFRRRSTHALLSVKTQTGVSHPFIQVQIKQPTPCWVEVEALSVKLQWQCWESQKMSL